MNYKFAVAYSMVAVTLFSIHSAKADPSSPDPILAIQNWFSGHLTKMPMLDGTTQDGKACRLANNEHESWKSADGYTDFYLLNSYLELLDSESPQIEANLKAVRKYDFHNSQFGPYAEQGGAGAISSNANGFGFSFVKQGSSNTRLEVKLDQNGNAVSARAQDINNNLRIDCKFPPANEVKIQYFPHGEPNGKMELWFVKPGDKIEASQLVATVATESGIDGVYSPYTGVVKELKVNERDPVEVGSVILTLEDDGHGVEAKPSSLHSGT